MVAGLTAGCDDGPTRPSVPPGAAIVESVLDGDTVDVRIAGRRERVRLLGIDTPEIAHPDAPAECLGGEAWRYTAELIPQGSWVRLERDIVGRDDYGRLLAYVYRPDGLFVNARIVADGYASPLFIGPNVAARDEILAAAREARRARLGFWSRCAN